MGPTHRRTLIDCRTSGPMPPQQLLLCPSSPTDFPAGAAAHNFGANFMAPAFFEEGTAMKLVVAIIEPDKLNAVQGALDIPGACVLSISQVLTDRPELDCTGMYRGAEFRIRRRPSLRLEIATTDWLAEQVVAAITEQAYTADSGETRNATIFVLTMDDGTHCEFQDEETFHEVGQWSNPSELPTRKRTVA
jgi:nitrogen regulatory protein P-II 2